MIEILPPLGKYKYDTWRILPVKCYIDNSVRLRSCIRNINSIGTGLSHSIRLLGLFHLLLSLSVKQANGDFFLFEHGLHLVQPLPLLHRLLLLERGLLLEQGTPLHEALLLLLNVGPLPLEHVLRLA
jgi:hypothetical protein